MTENEAVMQLMSDRDAILDNPLTGEKRTLEDVRRSNKSNYKMYFVYELAIRALQEVQLYKKPDNTGVIQGDDGDGIFGNVTCVPDSLLYSEITEEEAISSLYMCQDLLLFDALTGESDSLEILKERGGVIYNSYMANEIAIKALQTIPHYRKSNSFENQ